MWAFDVCSKTLPKRPKFSISSNGTLVISPFSVELCSHTYIARTGIEHTAVYSHLLVRQQTSLQERVLNVDEDARTYGTSARCYAGDLDRWSYCPMLCLPGRRSPDGKFRN